MTLSPTNRARQHMKRINQLDMRCSLWASTWEQPMEGADPRRHHWLNAKTPFKPFPMTTSGPYALSSELFVASVKTPGRKQLRPQS